MSELAPQLDFRVDAEFRDNIPPLSDAEYAELERLLINEGCLHPLIVWEGEGILVDGHHRLRICEQHGIDYEVKPMPFLSRTHALLWQLRHQRGRRNISDYQRDLMALREQALLSEIARENQAHGMTAPGRTLSSNLKKASESIDAWQQAAGDNKTSVGSMHKTATIEAKAPEPIRAKARAGELSRHAAYELTKALEDVPQDVIDVVTAWDITDAELVPRLTHVYTNKAATWDIITTTGTLDGERPVARVSPTEFDGYLERASYEHRKAAQEERRRRLIEGAKQAQLDPTAKYRVIYADPPWQYGNTMPTNFTEQADYYPLMPIEDIGKLPVAELAEDNAVLFLWVTSPILAEAFDVIRAWGFTYKSSFVWDKVKHVMGHYNSVRHELLLVCVRGSCQPDVQRLFDSVVTEERTEHSRKPEVFREIIDTIYPYGKRIELFARVKVEGWDAYGNEL
jgi:N6-adenosine-specific RNA methylase IME4